MAMNFAHGTVRWLAADAVNTTYVVSGLGFQPKAIRFYWMGLGSATDQVSGTIHSRRGIGFATSTSSRRAVGTQDQDAATTMVCTSGWRDDCVAFTLTSTPAADGRLDLSSIDSGGFTLIVDDQGVVDLALHWEAWGGADITVASLVDIAEPAATGNVDYTVTGFTNGATDQVVMFAGVQTTVTVNSQARADSGLCVGFAAGVNAADNVVILGNSDDASTTADTDGYALDGECLAMITVAGGNPSARAQLTQFGTDNFRLNWIARATSNRRYIALAIKGGRWKAGGLIIQGDTPSATATVGSLAFTPLGLSVMGRAATKSTAGTSIIQDYIGLGSGSSTSSRRSMGHLSEDNSTSGSSVCEIDLILEYDQVLAIPSAAGGIQHLHDIDLMDSNSFRLISDDNGGPANEWIGYLTFGSIPIVTTEITPTVGALTLSGTVPVLKTVRTPATGALAVTGETPTVAILLVTLIMPSAGALVVEGVATTLRSAVFLTPSSGVLVVTGETAQPRIQTFVTPNAGALVVTGQTASVSLKTSIAPNVGSLTLVGGLATGVNIRVLNPNVGNLGLNGTSPPQKWTNSPSAGALTLTGIAAAIRREDRLTPITGLVIISEGSPNIRLVTFLVPSTGGLALSGQAAAVQNAVSITPAAGSLATTGGNVTLAGAIVPSQGTLSLQGLTPVLGGNTFLTPARGSLVLDGQQPNLPSPGNITPAAGSLALTGQAPRTHWTVTPLCGNVGIGGQVPTIRATAMPGTGVLTIVGNTPGIDVGGTLITPATGALGIVGQTPTLARGNEEITPGTGALSLTGRIPTVDTATNVVTVAVTIRGQVNVGVTIRGLVEIALTMEAP